jgi:hypothetical protein
VNAIKATWTNGQILPSEPVDWPEGSELIVEPVGKSDKLGLDESDWHDDPESIAAWIAAVEKLQPMVWAEGEREEYERYRKQVRQFNLEASVKVENWTDSPTEAV